MGSREAEWLVQLLNSLTPEQTITPVPIFVDNAGVVAMVFNPVDHQSNKHVKIACHYVRELTQRAVILPQKIKSEDNIADVLTKPLGHILFRNFVK